MKTSSTSPEQDHRQAVASVLRSVNSIWWATIEKRYSDAEFAAIVALAEIQDFSSVKDESPVQLRLPL